jgi:hypothetical protein
VEKFVRLSTMKRWPRFPEKRKPSSLAVMLARDI